MVGGRMTACRDAYDQYLEAQGLLDSEFLWGLWRAAWDASHMHRGVA